MIRVIANGLIRHQNIRDAARYHVLEASSGLGHWPSSRMEIPKPSAIHNFRFMGPGTLSNYNAYHDRAASLTTFANDVLLDVLVILVILLHCHR